MKHKPLKTEITAIITEFNNVLSGRPWFGRSVYDMLEDVKESKAGIQPGKEGHSLIELIWHMNTWARFTYKRLQNSAEDDLETSEALDWREIDPSIHTWAVGVAEFKKINAAIVAKLQTADDSLLDVTVDFREYNFRFLLNGLIQHNIYHLGQIAMLTKIL